ncbi:MAG: hypothetical protein WC943_07295, partial [Elusimicrobiota bacterium]
MRKRWLVLAGAVLCAGSALVGPSGLRAGQGSTASSLLDKLKAGAVALGDGAGLAYCGKSHKTTAAT